MATVLYSIPAGSSLDTQITQAVGSPTVAANIELTVDLQNTMDGNSRPVRKEEVILALNKLIDFIIEGGKTGGGIWPPQ